MLNTRRTERWAVLYQRALFEEDVNTLPARVEEAQLAIQQRAMELWHASSVGRPIDLRERHELETALYFLKLQRSIGTHSNAS